MRFELIGKNQFPKKIFFMIYMISFLLGIIFANWTGKNYIQNIGILSDYFINRYKHTEINGASLFLYVLEKRMAGIVLIGTLGITFWGIIILLGGVLWFGFSSGMFLSAATMKYGFKGIFISLGCILPQYLIYVPAFIFLVSIVYSIWMELYFPSKVIKRSKKTKTQLYGEYILLFFIVSIIMLIGIMLETYVNPVLLKRILTNF